MKYMYIFEMIFLMFFSLTNFNKKMYMGIVLISISFYAYIYDPPVTFDLYRHFLALDSIRLYGEYSLVYLTAPLSREYFFLIAKFNDNHLLPVVTSLLIYLISFFVINKACKKFGVVGNRELFVIFLFVALYEYPLMLSNIRYPLALALFSLFFYYDVFEQKKYFRMLYILLLFLHPGTAILIGLRILSCLKRRYIFLILMVGTIAAYLIGDNLLIIVLNIIAPVLNNDVFVTGMHDMFLNYTSEDAFRVAPVMLVPEILRSIFLLAVIVSVKCFCKENFIKYNDFFVFCSLGIFVAYITLLTGISNGNIFSRIGVYYPIMSVFSFIVLTGKLGNSNLFNIKIITLSYIFLFFLVLWGKIYEIDFFPFLKL